MLRLLVKMHLFVSSWCARALQIRDVKLTGLAARLARRCWLNRCTGLPKFSSSLEAVPKSPALRRIMERTFQSLLVRVSIKQTGRRARFLP